MEVLFITNQFKTGGVERVFINIARNTDKRLHLLPLHKNFDEDFIKQIPSNVTILKNPVIFKRSLIDLFYFHKAIKSITKQLPVDEKLIVVNFSDTLTTLLFTILINADRKISWIHCNPYAIKNSRFGFLYKRLYSCYDEIVCLCNLQAKIFKNVFFSSNKVNITICNNLIDIKIIEKLSKEEINFHYKYILMVARIDFRSKDFYTVINAYNLLPEKIKKEYKFILLGDGQDKQRLEHYVKEKNLTENILLLGQDANPFKWYAHAYFSILSSKSEGFSLAVAESLACNCPVIASNCIAGPSDILQENEYGLLFQVGDEKKLLNNMMLYFNNENFYNGYKAKSLRRVFEINEQGKKALKQILEV